MADWEEVRRLAADFQRIQAASTVHRLSERNCIELVNKLLSMGLAEVVYTLDGKEYVTPHHLEREVRDELTIHRGRINVVDLQQILNVDLSHIEARVADLLKHDRSLFLLRGELIDKSYIHRLCDEINDTLQEAEQVSIADLSKKFGLPIEFLVEHIESSLGTRIKGQLDRADSEIIYTDAYVSRYHARIRGLFSAITRPTAVGPIIAQGGFQEKLFHSVLHEMISSGQLRGSLNGRLDKAVYIPEVYTKMQNRWADSFLTANGYLEYDALSRLGIEDPKSYVRSRYGNRASSETAVLPLVSCCVGSLVQTEVEGVLEEVQTSGGWVDVLPILPSPCVPEDATLLLQETCKDNQDLRLFGSIVITKSFLQSCFQVFQPLLKEKAQKEVKANPALLLEMSSKAAEQETAVQKKRKGGGASGGGKKGGKGRRRESEEMESGRGLSWELVFMPPRNIVQVLSEHFPDCSEELFDNIAEELRSPLQEAFQEEIRANVATLVQGPSAGQQRKRHANLQDKVQGLWNSTRLFEKALGLFEGDTEAQLSRYLLRTLCTDLTNTVLFYLAEDTGLDTPSHGPGEMTAKERSTLTSKLPEQMKRTLTAVNSSLNGKDVSLFIQLFEALCSEEYCGLMLKKPDRKKERQLIFSHQQSLMESLKEEQEPAMVLHLVVVLLFQQHTNCMIHAPGKLVPSIITFLSSRLSESERSKLRVFQDLVMLQLKQSRAPSSAQPAEPKTDTNLGQVEETPAASETVSKKGSPAVGESGNSSEESGAVGNTSDSVQQRTETMAQNLGDIMSSLKQLVLKPAKEDNQ